MLEDQYCLKITGWTKTQLNQFSSYLKLNDNKFRTKLELIAIYRYWLRKGIDQSSLSMFKNETNQQDISRYLGSARVAINRDFVPFFLGAENKTREFFVSHNTVSVNELFQLRNKLAIVVDGSYIRIEKSLNNNFQYLTYSEQKKDNLLKPFLITCADGYIIDCLVPFAANKNDAEILRCILEKQTDLKNILLKDQTIVFLDRGIKSFDLLKLLKKFFSLFY
jgi:hypothetical protein